VLVVRLAFRYGINAIDTSPYYYPSEFILGRCLSLLAEEHPRSTYYLCTKAGRYGPNLSEFDYSPRKIRSSVEASLRRLKTDYLDLVYLHDSEFVAEQVGKGQQAGMAARLASQDNREGQEARKSLGLAPGDESKIHGRGDETILAAVATLFELKDEGKIRNVGISGYPLPALLRISRLVASRAPYRPLDAILSYSNHTLHSDLLPAYVQLFNQPPTVVCNGKGQLEDSVMNGEWTPPLVLNGSPFSMGLLTDAGPPSWHPASEELKQACKDAAEELHNQKGDDDKSTLAITALTYGIRGAELAARTGQGPALRTLLGMSTPEQVHSAVDAYRVLLAGATPTHQNGNGSSANNGSATNGHGKEAPSPIVATDQQSEKAQEKLRRRYQQQVRNEEIVLNKIDSVGKRGWSWASPGEDA
jgi:aryl-alcohol dehydrogenase-like predicted oxidoreductase